MRCRESPCIRSRCLVVSSPVAHRPSRILDDPFLLPLWSLPRTTYEVPHCAHRPGLGAPSLKHVRGSKSR
ncbi:hypothetical protein AB1N83_008857 [Pleurotus pulmonarius]